jgi:hypothetical protein
MFAGRRLSPRFSFGPSIQTDLLTIAQGFGLLLTRARASVWIHGISRDTFQASRGLICELQASLTDYRWVFTTQDVTALEWLKKRYIDDSVYRTPFPHFRSTKRFFNAVSPRLLVVLGDGVGVPEWVWEVAVQRNVPIAWIEVDESALPAIRRRMANAKWPPRTVLCVVDDRIRAMLREVGVSEAIMFMTGSLHVNPTHSVNSKILRAIESGLKLQAFGQSAPDAWPIPSFRDKVGQSHAWTVAAKLLTRHRLNDLGALRRRLGNPNTILCLGNGPSSEDPLVLDLHFDAIFRANHIWQKRGQYTDPDVVFVGDPSTLRNVRPCVYGFSSIHKEYGMLLRNLWSNGPKPIEYFTVERLLTDSHSWTLRYNLSNGVMMIMTAAALLPAKLIIAGIDLYLHPQGRYPGDSHANNKGGPLHDRNADLEAIDGVLRTFPNETVIIGDVLRESLNKMSLSPSKY